MIGKTFINDSSSREVFLEILEINQDTQLDLQVTDGTEHIFVLIRGQIDFILEDQTYRTAVRSNPFNEKPEILLVSTDQHIILKAMRADTLLAHIHSPCSNTNPVQFVSNEMIRETIRGEGNWSRNVRLGAWSDNTTGGSILIGETVIPPGNWSTMPAHKHDRFMRDSLGIAEVPYQELYFCLFEKPEGFSLARLFNDSSDRSYCIHDSQVLFIPSGYHTLCNSPLSSMYHLTIMAGPHRQSTAMIHPDFTCLLGTKDDNPFRNQESKSR